jgi:hypothetical protein
LSFLLWSNAKETLLHAVDIEAIDHQWKSTAKVNINSLLILLQARNFAQVDRPRVRIAT